MKKLSNRTIAIIALVAVAVLAIGVFAIQNYTKTPTPVVENGEGEEDQERKEGDEENEEELVWYEIPELGIEFLVTPKVKNELVYSKRPNLNVVDLSTKTLATINENCSAENGAPLGGVSRVYGVPTDPIAPCGGGYKMREFSGGYFCYTQAQSACTNTSAQYNEQVKPIVNTYNQLFTSEEFWNAAEVSE